MNVREFALVAFSILAQMSVGSFIILGVVHLFVERRAGLDQADQMRDRALLAIVPILGLGLLASLLHLGNPLIAYKAVSKVGSSWLSREILFSATFFVVGAAFAFMQWKKISTPTVRNIIEVIAALIGLVLVFIMSQVYQIRTVPAWNTIATPITFFTTTFLLGTLAVGAAYVANYGYLRRKDADCAEMQCSLLHKTLRWLMIAAIVLLGIEFLAAPMYVAYLASLGGAAATSAGMMVGEFGLVFALRLILVFLGVGVLSVFIFQNAAVEGKDQVLGYLTYAAFALVLVGEVLGRFLFYATYVRVGI